jgi:hypothetical protein
MAEGGAIENCFGHLLAWLLLTGDLGTCAVGFGLLDSKLHVTVLSQWSTISAIPSRRKSAPVGVWFRASSTHARRSLPGNIVGRYIM